MAQPPLDLAKATELDSGDCSEDRSTQVNPGGCMQACVRAIEAWGLTDSDARKILAVDHQTWMQIKSGKWKESLSREQLKRIATVTAIYNALYSCFGTEANRWAMHPNEIEMFHGRRPVDAMIEEGLPMMEKAQIHTRNLLVGMFTV